MRRRIIALTSFPGYERSTKQLLGFLGAKVDPATCPFRTVTAAWNTKIPEETTASPATTSVSEVVSVSISLPRHMPMDGP